MSRFMAILVGTFTDLGEFLYSLIWGRRQARLIQQLLSNSQPSTHGRVIVSFTTLPDRILNLEPTIRSLLEQTRPPDEIVLAIPKFSIRQNAEYVVPAYLSSIPKLRILRCEKDWGPATKFIPVIQEELANGRGDTLIMVVDDDRVYPRNAFEIFLHHHNKIPNAVLCFRGALIPRNLTWFLPRIFRASQIRETKRVAVITGTAGYLIQPRFFDATLWDYSHAPESAFYVDDIWISGCLARRGIERYVVPASSMMRSVRSQSGTMNLYDVPKGSVRSNSEVIRFFRDAWDAFS
jgi:Glycosyl transferase family 2